MGRWEEKSRRPEGIFEKAHVSRMPGRAAGCSTTHGRGEKALSREHTTTLRSQAIVPGGAGSGTGYLVAYTPEYKFNLFSFLFFPCTIMVEYV